MMRLKKQIGIALIAVAVCCLAGPVCLGQQGLTDTVLAGIQKADDWRVYGAVVAHPANVPVDSLGVFPYYSLNRDSVDNFFAGLAVIPLKREPVWMGMYVGSYRSRGRLHKILISTYGGFFMDVGSGRYYSLVLEERDAWTSYVTDCVSTLSANQQK